MPKVLNIDVGQVRELAATGHNDPEIAKQLGCGTSTINRIRQEHGIPPARPRRAVDPEAVRQLAEQGLTNREIANELGLHQGTVHAARKTLGIPTPPRAKPASPNGEPDTVTAMARVEMRAAVYRMLAEKLDDDAIREKAGCTPEQLEEFKAELAAILKGKPFRHWLKIN